MKNWNPWVVDYCDEATEAKWREFDEMNENVIEYDYFIPKQWQIGSNLSFLNTQDTKAWNKGRNGDPWALNLDYWLKTLENGKKAFNRSNIDVVTFSVGKRDCLGQALARKELQSFLGNLMLNYKISAINNNCDAIKFNYQYEVITQMKEIPVNISKR